MTPNTKLPRSFRTPHYIFAAVLLLRVLSLARLATSPFLLPSRGDMHFYNDWAQRILDGHGLDHFAFYGLPLYAFLLATIYKLVGFSPFIPGFLQAVLDAATAVLLYKIGAKIFAQSGSKGKPGGKSDLISANRGWLIGLAAAAGWAFFVPAEAYSIILMPTVWLVFIYWFVTWQIVKCDAAPGRVRSFLIGLLIGVTAMGIATILFAAPLVAAAIVLRWDEAVARSAQAFRKAGAIALLALGIVLGTSPAWIHNYFVARDPVFLSAHSGVNFWIGNNPAANGYPRIPPGLRAGQTAMLQDSIDVAEAEAGHALPRSAVSHQASAIPAAACS